MPHHHHSHDKHSKNRSRSRSEDKEKYSIPKSDHKKHHDKHQHKKEKESHSDKERPCFTPSGILNAFQHSHAGIQLKFPKPHDAQIAQDIWKLYTFKNDKCIGEISLKSQPYYVIGKDDRIADIVIKHKSCSSQHAILAFRQKGIQGIVPYIMDLKSAHHTELNGDAIDSQKYYELLHKDLLKFGKSKKSYIIMRMPKVE